MINATPKTRKPSHPVDAITGFVLLATLAVTLLLWSWPPLEFRVIGAGILLAIASGGFRNVHWQFGPWG